MIAFKGGPKENEIKMCSDIWISIYGTIIFYIFKKTLIYRYLCIHRKTYYIYSFILCVSVRSLLEVRG